MGARRERVNQFSKYEKMASVKIWFRSDGAMMHPVAKGLFLKELSAMTAECLGIRENSISVHTVETEDILVGGHAQNCAHAIIEHLGEMSAAINREYNKRLGALMKLHYHVEHYMCRFICVQPHEMMMSSAFEEDLAAVQSRYTY